MPPVVDPTRTLARATQLLVPSSVISHVTAARLYELEGLGYWDASEQTSATLPLGCTRWQRSGMRLHFSDLAPDEIVDVRGIRATSPQRTLVDCAAGLDRRTFVCLADSALRLKAFDGAALAAMKQELIRKGRWRPAQWLDLADGRSESPAETQVRLVLHDGGFPPDSLQHEVFTPGGFFVARLDIVWTHRGKKVGLEVDSRFHDGPRAPYRDREKLNALKGLGWDIRLVTAYDASRRPGYILQQVADAFGA